MKNTDFILYLVTKGGSTTSFSRDRLGWSQMAPSGIKRRCTAEQVLNHLLPALALGDPVIDVHVKLKQGRHFRPRLEAMKRRP